MRFLAKGIPRQQLLGSRAGSIQVPSRQSSLGHERQRVLESVRQSFSLGGEAIVSQPFGKVASIQRDGSLDRAARSVQAGFEGDAVQLHGGRRTDPERVRLDLQDAGWIQVSLHESMPDQPQGLTKRAGGRGVGLRPQVCGDRLARAWSSSEHQQGEQRLGVPAGDRDDPGRACSDFKTSEEIHVERCARGGGGVSHGDPSIL